MLFVFSPDSGNEGRYIYLLYKYILYVYVSTILYQVFARALYCTYTYLRRIAVVLLAKAKRCRSYPLLHRFGGRDAEVGGRKQSWTGYETELFLHEAHALILLC